MHSYFLPQLQAQCTPRSPHGSTDTRHYHTPDRRHTVLSDWTEPIGIRRIRGLTQQGSRHPESVHVWKLISRHALTPSTMLSGPLVGTILVNFSLAAANNVSNSCFVRSRPPMISMCTSSNFPHRERRSVMRSRVMLGPDETPTVLR